MSLSRDNNRFEFLKTWSGIQKSRRAFRFPFQSTFKSALLWERLRVLSTAKEVCDKCTRLKTEPGCQGFIWRMWPSMRKPGVKFLFAIDLTIEPDLECASKNSLLLRTRRAHPYTIRILTFNYCDASRRDTSIALKRTMIDLLQP